MSEIFNSSSSEARRGTTGGLLRLHISEVWLRFLLAIAGLVLAFAAALFSTVSRESGDMWATFILASAALLLATIVGLTTVPYLARRVAVARVREALDYNVTKAGIAYVLFSLVIGIAALNTGNNLLYIVVSAMLAALFISGLASGMVLRDLDVELRLPEHVFAGRDVPGRILLRNHRRWTPSFSVSVVPPKLSKSRNRWRWQKEVFAFPPGRPEQRQWFRLPDRSLRRVPATPTHPTILNGPAYFPYVAAGAEVSAELSLQFQRRGRYQQEALGLATRFPFALFQKMRRVPLSREIVVFPSIEPTNELFQVLPLITGEFETFLRGRGYNLYRIREYMPEDSARHIDWKATAKSGSPKVREFTREDERKLRIIFDNPGEGTLSADEYEKAVQLVASLAWHFSAEGSEITFASQEYACSPDLYAFLEHLASIQPDAKNSLVDEPNVFGDYNLVLTTRLRGSIPTALWACSYFIFLDHAG
jgi:uncharacterized protein (DUF58 family)